MADLIGALSKPYKLSKIVENKAALITALEFDLEKRGIANMAFLIERVDSGEEGVVLSHGGLGFFRVKGVFWGRGEGIPTPTSSGPSRHPLRFQLSTFSSFGTPCALNHLLGCTTVSWMSNGSTFINTFSEMLSISLQPMTIIPLWLHHRVILLSSKTAGFDKPRHPVLQILWVIIHRSNINHAERIWEEFVQSIQTFLTDEIKGAPYYEDYQEHVAKYQQIRDVEPGKAEEGGAT
ncbi:hypothetical protein Tco_1145127 [Tanacetum coccineum]